MATIKEIAEDGSLTVEDENFERGVIVHIDENTEITADGKPEDVFSMTNTIEEAGLEIPQVTRLLKALKNDGINIDTRSLTPQKAAEAIKYALGGRK